MSSWPKARSTYVQMGGRRVVARVEPAPLLFILLVPIDIF